MSISSISSGAWRTQVGAALAAGRITDALSILREASSSTPGSADIWSALGAVALQSGELAEAESALRRCLGLLPGHVDARVNLASLLLSLGRTSEALGELKQAHQYDASHAGAWLLLARARLVLGDASGAERCLRQAESILPDLPAHALFQLAGVLQERKAFADAKPYYQRAIAKEPTSFLYRGNYADMLCSIGELDQGFSQHREVLSREPDRLRSHLALNLTLPGIHGDTKSLTEARDHYAAGLENLHERVEIFRRLPVTEIEMDIRWSNYLLAYHGQDDLDLQRRFSDFQSALLEGAGPTMKSRRAVAADAPIRIGFVSSFFYQCTVGWYFSSWIKDLDPTRFHAHIYSIGPVRDTLSESLAANGAFKQLHHLPLFRLAQTILADELDVLVFPELGLCPTTFTLACMRLAPVQCAGWGHPVTSGHGNVDLYFSSDLIEPPNAAAHYSERLVRLPGLGTRYPRPVNPEPVTRAQFNIPEKAPLALISQSLFKLHPDNDALYRRVREAAPGAHFLFFEDSFDRNTELFSSRLSAQGMVRSRDYTFLPRMSHARFLGINQLADVMLDTLHWSGGNTSLDALAMGLPVVTLPGAFMRGRQSLGMLNVLHCEGLAVDSPTRYVDFAASLLGDASSRDAWSARILAGAEQLFDQPGAPAALQSAIEAEVRRRRLEH
ncbi:MAG: tetratricopeptide repeat protein [Betaproteobacteria bacterium]|nr:tetratricopeptide repeat protein [Betaproteobacteria bacterium]